jgi:4-amino-4-deoxy-L-arabinose transferase-like glycosyltransferase
MWRLGDMPLFGDEAYYLRYVDHPAPAYVDHPAGIAVLLWLSTALGGRSEAGLRWLNALLSAACVPLVYAMGRRYVSEAGGLIAAAAVAFGPVFVVTGRVAFPDSLHAALMLANLLALAPLLDGEKDGWRWVLFGLSLALLINVKLSSAFYIVALALYFLIWRRDLLHQRGMWLAAGIAALGLIPVMGWNATHDWAGVRWAVAQGNAFGLAPLSRGARAHHAWLYHTPPMVLLGLLAGVSAALALWQAARDRGANRPALLALIGLCVMLPVLLSNANNPRNLMLGLLAWLPLIGLLLASLPRAGARALAACVALLLGWTAAYGIGTVVEMVNYRERLPRSIAAQSVTHDAADWPQFCVGFTPTPGALIYAVGYSYAAQVQFYCGVPVYTNVPQLRIWGVPETDAMTVIAVDGHPIERIDSRLRADFASVSGPSERAYARKGVTLWEVAGRRAPIEQVLEDLDYLRLAGAAQ